MRRRLPLLGLLLVGATVLTPTVAPAQDAPPGHGGYTDVRIEGMTVVIVVNLTVVYDGTLDPAGAQYVRDGFAAAQTFWNDAFDRVGGCPKLRLELNVRFLSSDSTEEEDPLGHNVYLHEQWRSGTFPDGRGLPSVEYPGLQSGDVTGEQDIAYPYDGVSVAYLPEWVFEDPWALAHELGHLFGLGDDYLDGEITPGREGTLMGGTLGGDYVDQSILSDIANIAKQAGYQLPECWEGTFTYDYSGPALTCSVDYSVTLGVAEGEVSGDITFEDGSCPGATSGGPVTGTKSDSAFSLEAVSMGPGHFAVPITDGNRATATFSSTPEEIRVFDVRCESCGSGGAAR